MNSSLMGYQDLNVIDDYKTNHNFTTYTKKGKTVIPAGKIVKFVHLSHNLDLLIKFEHNGETLFETIPALILSPLTPSYLNKIITLKRDIILNTQDDPVTFSKGSLFIIRTVFYLENKKHFLISYLNEDGGATAISGVVSINEVDNFIDQNSELNYNKKLSLESEKILLDNLDSLYIQSEG